MSRVELLAPVGDWDCLIAAVQNGADCVYFGATLFNARASAKNFDIDTLKKAIQYCKIRDVKTFLTLNILIKNSEFKDAIQLAKSAYEFGIDGIIVQDIGLATFLIDNFPDLPIHASTQMTVHNLEGVKELSRLGFKRVVLAREISLDEIKYICKNSDIETEVFVHGALCMSYSGQCLFSSVIGGRSGNRGQCAGPCRLPYKLIKQNNNSKKESVVDTGCLLSPKDLCALEYLPELINAGVKCFKIEGRLKSPEYVATVTRIYRKYIDKVLNGDNYIIQEDDMKDLLQIFNRGGFSTGHLSNKPNRDFVFKERSNNIGLFLGNISKFNPDKGHITLTLHEDLAIGDCIYTEKGNIKYTVSELMQKTLNIPTAKSSMRVTIGRMKGNISVGDKVYKLSSKALLDLAKSSYSNTENIKNIINCTVIVKENEPISLSASYGKDFINLVSDVVPVKAISSPITEERIKQQISKTGNTPFSYKNIKIELDEGLYIPNISVLNELRRNCIDKIQSLIIQNGTRHSNLDTSNIKFPYEEKSKKSINRRKISILLRKLDLDSNYQSLETNHIDNIYLPLKFFASKNYSEIIKYLSENTNIYIYLPTIIKNNYKNIIKNSLENILSKYKIKGFVISNISNLKFLENYINDYDIVGNASLNIFNSFSIKDFSKYGLKRITLSRELSINEINDILKYDLDIETELIVYGILPIMSTNYCFLGQSNECYPECKTRCLDSNSSYYLLDRYGYKFKIVPDNIQCITSIFNNRSISINDKSINVSSIRLDFLDESIEEINKTIKKYE